jgi:hypothetical protein
MAGPIENLLGQVESAVNPITGDVRENNAGSYPRTLKEGAFFDGTGNTVEIKAGEFRKVGEGFVVPAQERYRWGIRSAEYEANQGYIFFNLQDSTPEEIPAGIRLQQRDAQERNIVTVFEEESTVLSASKSDRNQQTPLPLQARYPKVGRDSKLTIAAKPDSNQTVSQAESEFLLPVTVYPV